MTLSIYMQKNVNRKHNDQFCIPVDCKLIKKMVILKKCVSK